MKCNEAPWDMGESDIFKKPCWIYNPKLFNESFYISPHTIDRMYAYRGVNNIDELKSILQGGESGAFWSNFPDLSYFSCCELIVKNPYPDYKFLGELPTFRCKFKDIIAIYINLDYFYKGHGYTWVDAIRLYPIMSFEAFKKYYSYSGDLHKYYSIAYNNPLMKELKNMLEEYQKGVIA